MASAGSRAAGAAQAVTQGGGGRSRRRGREQMALKKRNKGFLRAEFLNSVNFPKFHQSHQKLHKDPAQETVLNVVSVGSLI